MKRFAECLAQQGWFLRTGGQGELDDIFHKVYSQRGAIQKTYVPYAHYRGYDAVSDSATTTSFEELDDIIKRQCLQMVEVPPGSPRVKTGIQKNLFSCSAPILLGDDLKCPSRFLITWSRESQKESPVVLLAKTKQIPVFDLRCAEHYERISTFVNQNKTMVAANC
jgi:hypothetical protein